MGSRLRAACGLIALLASACTCNCYPPASVPGVEEDPNVPPEGVDEQAYRAADAAGQACMVLEHLGCPEAHPKDVDCAESMRTLVRLGTFEKGNVICIRTSRTVERVRTCDVECPQ